MHRFKKLLKKNEKISMVQAVILGILGLFAVLVLLQMQQVWQMHDRLEVIDSLGDNNTKVIEEMGQAKNFLVSFGSDLNEIREALSLPTKEYHFGDLGDVELDDAEVSKADDLTVQVFELISSLGDYEVSVKRYDENLAAIKDYFAGDFWVANGLSVDGFRVYDDKHEGMELLNVTLPLNGVFEVEVYDGVMEIEGAGSAQEVIAALNGYFGGIDELRALIDKVNAARKDFVQNVFVGEDFNTVLAQKGLVISEESEEDKSYYWNLTNGDSSVTLKIFVSKLDGSRGLFINGDVQEFSLDAVNAVDTRTVLQIAVDEKVGELKILINDDGFKALLGKSGFSVGQVSDDEAKFSFEILDQNGIVLRVLYLDKVTGEVNVEVPDSGKVEDLASAIETLQSYGKKKLWI